MTDGWTCLSFLRLLWRALLPSFRLNEEQVCCEITSDLASLIILQLMMRKPVARVHKSKQSIIFLEGYVCLCVCICVWGSLCRGKNWSWTSDREGGTDGKWNFIHAEKVPQGQLCSWIIVYVFLPLSVSLSLSLLSVIMLSLLVQNSHSVYLGWRQSDKTVQGERWSLQFFIGLFTLHLPIGCHLL